MTGAEARPPVLAGAVLAAGASQRLGAPKQLVSFRGQPLLRHVVTKLEASLAGAPVAVVLGARRLEIAPCLRDTPVEVLVNEAWSEGLASSIRLVVRWALGHTFSSLLLTVVDQPLLSRAHLDRLVAAHAQAHQPVASTYDGVVGVPAIIPAACFDALLNLRGDRGAAGVLRSCADLIQVPWPAGSFDVDRPSDVERLRALPLV